VAKVIHNFGRADRVDRDALARLVSAISRFLEPEQAVAAAAGTDVEVVDQGNTTSTGDRAPFSAR
jgi:predicted YcjX-like family ATPase